MRTKTITRRGFTLVELLIVITIIGMLMALLLPAIQGVRERARQTTCMNNLKQLSTAMTSYATSGKGTFPGWVQWQKTTVDFDGDGVANDMLPISWAAKLLSQIDEQTLSDQLLTNNNGNGFNYAEPPKVALFACPSDVKPGVQYGYLSYVANAGYADIFSSGRKYIGDIKANGICHNLVQSSTVVRKATDDIKDGEATTLLLSENFQKDDITTGITNSWINSSQWNDRSGGLQAQVEQAFGMVWVFSEDVDNLTPPPTMFQPFNKDLRPAFSTYITERDTITGQPTGIPFRRPASNHPEIFQVVFVGGNTKALSETIDYRVYQQLMTPNGMKAEAFTDDGNSIPEANMGFMRTPLSNSEY